MEALRLRAGPLAQASANVTLGPSPGDHSIARQGHAGNPSPQAQTAAEQPPPEAGAGRLTDEDLRSVFPHVDVVVDIYAIVAVCSIKVPHWVDGYTRKSDWHLERTVQSLPPSEGMTHLQSWHFFMMRIGLKMEYMLIRLAAYTRGGGEVGEEPRPPGDRGPYDASAGFIV